MSWDNFKRLRFRKKKEIPGGLWMRCPGCENMVYRKTVEENVQICPECDQHFELAGPRRVELLVDDETFEELFTDMEPTDPLEFVARKAYANRLKRAQDRTGLKDACIVGFGEMEGHRVVFGVSDSRFLRGSMGSVVGEKITRGIETATREGLPFIFVSGSGGGARMDEGILSLMQMAKTSAALARHDEAGLLFVSILTNPTMGGAMASFAALGDVLIAEPKALLGFAGPGVIKQTIKQDIPPGFQRSEFLLEHGFVDMIVDRRELKETIVRIIDYTDPDPEERAA